MQCPFCQTDNREDRETCYVCGKDISTVRLVVNKSRQHYNDALEHAERGRVTEAIDELKNAIDLDATLVNAHVVLGTLYARQGQFPEARECWEKALALNPELARAHDYLERVETVQAVLPTLRTYRAVAALLLVLAVTLAALLIYAMRPDPGAKALRVANQLIEEKQYGQAINQLERARVLAKPGGAVGTAAAAMEHVVRFDLQQQVRVIQDLKYRQLFPEALQAIAELEGSGPDTETSGALSTIRSDISYYYHNLISQLYGAYEQGDVDFETLKNEINMFLTLYPASPDAGEISGYLERAESLEVQSAMEELRRRFALDNNVETAVEGLRELAPRLGNMESFQVERSAFIEEILSYQFNLFTSYLEQEEFEQASTLLSDIDRITTEFRDVVEVDISGAVDLAWSVLSDARRQYQLDQIEEAIADDNLLAAEEAIWDLLQEPDLTSAELGVVRSYWRQVNRRERLDKFYSTRKPADSAYFEQEVTDDQASRTLRLYQDVEDLELPRRQRVHLLGLAAASALRLGDRDRATSYSVQLRELDSNSTVTRAVRALIREKIEAELPPEETEARPTPKPTPAPTPTPTPIPKRDLIRVEPAQPRNVENE